MFDSGAVSLIFWLFLVCCRSGETSVADPRTVYRSSTDYLRNVCGISVKCLHKLCLLELISNLCRRSADKGGINSIQTAFAYTVTYIDTDQAKMTQLHHNAPFFGPHPAKDGWNPNPQFPTDIL